MKTILNSVVCAVSLLLTGFNSKAGEIAFSFSPPSVPLTPVAAKEESTRTTFAPIPKLLLASAPVPKNDGLEIRPKLELGVPSLTSVPAPTNSPPSLLDGKILELPEKVPFPNLHYVHKDWRFGNGTEGEDSFGRLWKLSPKSYLVFPYFKWEYPTRKEERVLVGVFWSKSF